MNMILTILAFVGGFILWIIQQAFFNFNSRGLNLLELLVSFIPVLGFGTELALLVIRSVEADCDDIEFMGVTLKDTKVTRYLFNHLDWK